MASFVVVALVVYIQKCITFMWVKLFKFKVSDFYMFRKIIPTRRSESPVFFFFSAFATTLYNLFNFED